MNNVSSGVIKNRGFTLLELLIAITVLSMMTALYVVQLGQVSDANERMQKRSDELKSLQVLFNQLSLDLEHVVERSVQGDLSRNPALLGADSRIEFTRAGWPNPMLLIQRSPLKRVSYELVDDVVYRQTWEHLDQSSDTFGAADSENNRPVLSGVKSFAFEYLIQNPDDESFEWKEEWPENASFGAESALEDIMPLSIKVTIEMERLGEIYRFFPVSENRFSLPNTLTPNTNAPDTNTSPGSTGNDS